MIFNELLSFFSKCCLQGEFTFWNILDVHKLLSYQIEESVVDLLLYLCKVVWKEYCDNVPGLYNPEQDKEPSVLMANLRKFDVLENRRNQVRYILVNDFRTKCVFGCIAL